MLAPWKESYDKPRQYIKKQRHYFTEKDTHYFAWIKVKVMVFPAIIYRCESWIIMKAEHWQIVASELWCWRRLLKILQIARISNQSILKEINHGFYWKDWCWSSSILGTWCKEPAHWKRLWYWERPKAIGEEGSRGWDGLIESLTQ